MWRIAPVFTNYVSVAVENNYLFRTDMGQWTWEQKVKRGSICQMEKLL